jgi:hypothetical protein
MSLYFKTTVYISIYYNIALYSENKRYVLLKNNFESYPSLKNQDEVENIENLTLPMKPLSHPSH